MQAKAYHKPFLFRFYSWLKSKIFGSSKNHGAHLYEALAKPCNEKLFLLLGYNFLRHKNKQKDLPQEIMEYIVNLTGILNTVEVTPNDLNDLISNCKSIHRAQKYSNSLCSFPYICDDVDYTDLQLNFPSCCPFDEFVHHSLEANQRTEEK